MEDRMQKGVTRVNTVHVEEGMQWGGGDKRLEVKRVTEGKNDTRKEYELCESIKKIIFKKWVYWE